MDQTKKVKGKSINNKDGHREDNPTKIKEVYADFYKELLTTKKATTEDEKVVEETVNKCIQAMIKKSEEAKIDPVTEAE